MVYAVDFDGTICEDQFPNIGEPKCNVIWMIKKLKTEGHKLILWTCRTGDALTIALDWCHQFDLKFDSVNMPLPEQIKKYNNDTRKVFADYYIDDRAIHPEELLNTTIAKSAKEYADHNKCRFCKGSKLHSCQGFACNPAWEVAEKAYKDDINRTIQSM